MYWNVGRQGHSPSTALTVVGQGPRPSKVGLRTLATYIPIINTINRLFHVKHFCLHMGTMVQNGYDGTDVQGDVSRETLCVKIYSVGCAFIDMPDVSAVVLLVSGFGVAAFSGSFLDWQSFCEQELQPRFVVKH